jgi:hypothetical protein
MLSFIHNYILKKKFYFFISSLVYALFLSPTPPSINMYLFIFVLLNLFFFSKELLLFFLNIFNKRMNIEKLIIVIVVSSFIPLIQVILEKDLSNINFRQVYRDYIFLAYLFIPYFFIKLKINNKDYIFILYSIIAMGYLIFFRLILTTYFNHAKLHFIFSDLLYIHMDVAILFSFNFLILYSFYKKNYLIFILFSLQYIFFVYFMKNSGTSIMKFNLIYLTLIILFNLYMSHKKLFQKKIPVKKLYLIFIIIFIALLSFIQNTDVTKIFNNRNFEYLFFIDSVNKASILNFFFGQGLGVTFAMNYITQSVEISYLHNFILYLIIKIGLVGFCLFFVYITIITKIWKFNFLKVHTFFEINNKNILFISYFFILLLGIFYTTFYKTINFWIIFGFLIKHHSFNVNEK